MLCPLPSTAFWGYRNDFWGMEVISAGRWFVSCQISIKDGRNSLFPGSEDNWITFFGFVYSQWKWCCDIYMTVVQRRSHLHVLTWPFPDSHVQLEPGTWCTRSTNESYDCIFLSLNRRRILARGCLLHLHVAMVCVLSSRAEFFSVTLKFLLFCLGAGESGRSNGPEMDIQAVSKVMWASSLLGWGHLSWELHCIY